MTSLPAVLVSVAALLFTVFSFWWMNWRPGKLVIGNLVQFAAGKATEGSAEQPNVVVITLPLVMFNSGARPLVIESVRLVAVGRKDLGTLLFEAVDSDLPSAATIHKIERDFLFLPAALKANEVIKKNFVFERRGATFEYENALFHFHLEAKFSGSRHWQKVKDIELDLRDASRFSLYALNSGYRSYESLPRASA